MKSSRFRHSYRANASKLHKKVGDILRKSSSFGVQEIYQEYPVSRINTDYRDNSHHFDWVIPKLGMVIEAHGEGHYNPIAWDGDVEKSIEAFHSLKRRDNAKKEACLQAGYIFVEVPYTLLKTLDETKLLELIEVGKAKLELYNEEHDMENRPRPQTATETFKEQKKKAAKAARKRYLASDSHQEQLRNARENRKEQYRRQKAIKHGH